MTALGRFLGTLYALTALAVAHCSVHAYEAGSVPYTLLLAGCSLAALTAACHTWHLRDELRSALVRLERASRPPTTTQDTAVHQLLAGACCERWWTSAGAEHETDHCTRKGHHA